MSSVKSKSVRLARIGLVLSAAAALLALTAAPAMATNGDSNVRAGLDYLHACQNSDGGFAEKGQGSSDAITAWAITAIAASGEDPGKWKESGNSPVEYLAGQSARWRQTTDYARTILAVVAAGKNPRSFGGVNLVAKLRDDVHAKGEGAEQIGQYINSHVWGMIALKAAGESPSDAQVRWLKQQQNSDGGWGWAPNVASDSNDTAAALQALKAAGVSRSSAEVSKALSYLRKMQNSDGGFAYASGAPSDANSTAWVSQGLEASNQSVSAWSSGGKNPLMRLRSLQADDGSIRYSDAAQTSPLLTTVQALMALNHRPFPVAASGAPVSEWRPNIKREWPVHNAVLTNAPGESVKFRISDGGTGVAKSGVKVLLDGKSVRAKISDGNGQISVAGIKPGTHRVSVSATDRAGNSDKIENWTFMVNAAPVASNAASASAAPSSSILATTAPRLPVSGEITATMADDTTLPKAAQRVEYEKPGPLVASKQKRYLLPAIVGFIGILALAAAAFSIWKLRPSAEE